jgi:hypothetical protein
VRRPQVAVVGPSIMLLHDGVDIPL